MRSLSAFELVKYGEGSNANDRLHDMPIVSYGRVIKVIDEQTVVVEASVKTSSHLEVYNVPLLSLSSSLAELNVYPKAGDKVLLLFLQRFDPRMFTAEETIENRDATGYNSASVVGILLTAFRGYADTVMHFFEDEGISAAAIDSGAKWQAVFSSSAGVTFCRAVFNSGDEQLISALFGQGRPFIGQFLDSVTREYGFAKDGDGKLIELDAAVTERYSQYAPIKKDTQGTQDITIGIDDDKKDTEAGVSVKIGAKADINIDSKSGKTEKYDKDVSFESKGNISVKASQVEIANNADTLGGLIEELFSEIETAIGTALITTPNGPGSATVNPASIAALAALKARFKALLS